MMPSCEYTPGMLVRVRDDVYEGQNGIYEVDEYRGLIMTVSSIERRPDGTPKGVRFAERRGYWWAFDQIEPYVDPDYAIDPSEMTSLLEIL